MSLKGRAISVNGVNLNAVTEGGRNYALYCENRSGSSQPSVQL